MILYRFRCGTRSGLLLFPWDAFLLSTVVKNGYLSYYHCFHGSLNQSTHSPLQICSLGVFCFFFALEMAVCETLRRFSKILKSPCLAPIKPLRYFPPILIYDDVNISRSSGYPPSFINVVLQPRDCLNNFRNKQVFLIKCPESLYNIKYLKTGTEIGRYRPATEWRP